MPTNEIPVLWHIKPSHYNEKARWALDYKRVPHRREAPLPGTHMPIALAMTRRVATFPVLKIDGRAIGDSTRIIAALEERFPDPPLYPAEPAARRRALEIEDYLDEHFGADVRRIAFWEFMRSPEYLPSKREAAVFKALVGRRYSINERTAAESLLSVRAGVRLIEDLLGGRDHLVGDRFTVADLTAAALLGPVVRPPKFPYGNSTAPIPPRLEQIGEELTALPAGQWALRTYERYRPPSAEVGTGGRDRLAESAPAPREPAVRV